MSACKDVEGLSGSDIEVVEEAFVGLLVDQDELVLAGSDREGLGAVTFVLAIEEKLGRGA